MRNLLRMRRRPTAVVATNDVFAVGRDDRVPRGRRRIPADLSITGVDNTDLGATQTPAAHQRAYTDRGDRPRCRVQLVARLEGEPAELYSQLPFELVIRGSTAAPPRR